MLGERCVWWWGFRVEWLGLEAAACGLRHSRRGGIVRWWGSGGPEPHFELPTPSNFSASPKGSPGPRVRANPLDEVSIWRTINMPPRGVRQRSRWRSCRRPRSREDMSLGEVAATPRCTACLTGCHGDGIVVW